MSRGWILSSCAAVLAAACRGEQAEPAPRPVTVDVAAAAADPDRTAWFAAVVESERRASVATKVSGTITDVLVHPGDRVRAGQRLLEVDARTARAMARSAEVGVDSARLGLAQAERNLERMERLVSEDLVARVQLEQAAMARDQAAAELARAMASRREARVNVDYGGVEAPFDGVVVQLLAEEGDLAAPGRPLVTVEDDAALKLVVRVPQETAHGLSVGDEASVRLGQSGEQHAGTITAILPMGGRRQAGYRVEVRPSGARAHALGAAASVGLASRFRAPVTLVPAAALIRKGALRGLYVAEPLGTEAGHAETAGAVASSGFGEGMPPAKHRAVLRWVALEEDPGEDARVARVISGVAPGELVVVGPAPDRLRTGIPLVVRDRERP